MGNRRHIPADEKRLILRMASKPDVTRADIARLAGCHPDTITRIRRVHRKTGDVVNKPVAIGRRRKLTGLEVSFIIGCIERTSDATLRELQEDLVQVCGVDISLSTISRTLKQQGITRKKITRIAAERNEHDRALYQMITADYYGAHQLVFVDESARDNTTARRQYGWSIEGAPSFKRECFVRGVRYSILPALSLDGILYLEVLDRPITASAFNLFIEALLECMNPWPMPNSVIVMDNASIHKSEHLRDMIERSGKKLLYLPTYSPDLNPIEEAFSTIKACLRASNERELHEYGPYKDPYKVV